MTHPIIKTDNYILITSDEEIQIGDIVLSKLNQIILFSKYYDPKLYKKVIAHLPLNNSPMLEGVPLLPPLPDEEDVDKLAEKEFPHISTDERIRYLTIVLRDGFVTGHKKAKEKYKFTEEDMIKAIDYCKYNRAFEYDFEKVMESISQPKLPVGFKCRIEYLTTSPVIINGVMQGEWIFE